MTRVGLRDMQCSHAGIAVVMASVLFAVALILTPTPAFAVGPTILSLSTYAAPAGSPVTILGSGFGTAKPDSFVTFSGIRASVTSWSDSQIIATVPDRAVPGYVGVIVGGVDSNGMFFVPAARPIIDSLSAYVAPIGSTLTIRGSGFGSLQGAGYVTFGGVRAPVTYWSDSRVVVTVPKDIVPCYVGVTQKSATSNGKWFVPTVAPVVDTLSSTTPSHGSIVTVYGSYFGATKGATSALTLNGQTVEPLSWSDHQITFAVPAGSDSGFLGVWKSGVCSNGVYVFVTPQLTSLSSWWAEPGSPLTLVGTGFGTTTDRVLINGTGAPVQTWTDTQIVVTVPAGAGEGYVGVWRGEAASNGLWLLATKQPSIASLSTTSAAAGENITISGTDFGPAGANSTVALGGTQMAVVSWSETQITATVPAGAVTGYVGVWKSGIASNGMWLLVP